MESKEKHHWNDPSGRWRCELCLVGQGLPKWKYHNAFFPWVFNSADSPSLLYRKYLTISDNQVLAFKILNRVGHPAGHLIIHNYRFIANFSVLWVAKMSSNQQEPGFGSQSQWSHYLPRHDHTHRCLRSESVVVYFAQYLQQILSKKLGLSCLKSVVTESSNSTAFTNLNLKRKQPSSLSGDIDVDCGYCDCKYCVIRCSRDCAVVDLVGRVGWRLQSWDWGRQILPSE